MKDFTFSDIELADVNKHYKKKKSVWFWLIDVFFVLYFLCILGYLAFSIVFIKAQVVGISMQPLFNAGLEYSQDPKVYETMPQDVAYANRYQKGTNGDIVLLEILEDSDDPTSENIIIKRIIATGGQRVTLRREEDGNYYYYVSNNIETLGEKLTENYVSEDSRNLMDENYFKAFKECFSPMITLSTEMGRGAYFVVPEGEVFVLGDNRPYSRDSHIFGTVKTEKILGKVSFYYAHNENIFSFFWSKFWGLF